MKKYIVLMIALVCGVMSQAKVLYLNTGGSSLWETDGANKFVIWHWQGSNTGTWSQWMTKVEGNIWKTEINDGSDHVIFCRCNTSLSSPEWGEGKVWNQTGDLAIPSGKDMYVMTSWTEGNWAKYGESGGSSDEGGGNSGDGDSVTPSEYSTAVPSQCEDVMLQAFYWNSYGGGDNSYGSSTWQALQGQVDEINSYFDLVWLPPSSRTKDNMGYLPSQYPNQNNKMGNESDLKALIKAFHKGGTRVVADVVINHAGDQNWVNFLKQDFGEYGKFEPNSTWITSNDEAQGHGQLGNNADDGQESNANYPDARDWDHKNSDVQKMCRAYLQFLKGAIGYDGFRFDYCGGYHVSHINDYVSNAKPYFSVMEYWNGNPGVLKARIDDASKNTMTFDFASFYTCYQQGIASNNYGKLVKPGLRGQGYAKYAVNFVDNHDTFKRGDINNSDCGNTKDGSSINNKNLIMQCNAYLLSMPGVPCVFWPHWYKYKSEIQKMITARKMAGVHSESSVQETSGSDYYEATVTGKYGKLIVYLGSAANKTKPDGFTEAIKIDKVAIYYTGDGNSSKEPDKEPDNEGIEETVSGKLKTEKVLQNGQLYIRFGETVYDIMGNKIQ